MTYTFDQVHLGVPDIPSAVAWYRKHLGGEPGDHVDRVMFGSTRIIYLKSETAKPNRGVAIDHIALSFPDLERQMGALDGSGARVIEPVAEIPGLYRGGVIEDPWGVRIEVVEDSETLGFHHVHLSVPDPAEARIWYVERFGGRIGRLKGRLEGVQYGSTWVLADQGEAEASRGHAIDHIGWRMPDLLADTPSLKAKGVRFTTEPHAGPPHPYAPTFMSFVEDPWGVRIELLQRPTA